MASEWKTISLAEAGVSLIDCVHKTPPASSTGYPYIAIPQMKNGHLNLSDVRLISPENFIEWTKKTYPKAYDVVLSRRCNPGETALVPQGFKGALGQNLVLLRSDGENIFLPFLRWLVRSPQWWQQVEKFINVGAIFESLKCVDIPNFQLSIPPLSEQKAIAHILGTLDDKIELNQQMNQTLEAMAQAIFKSWFVDFDPVRAKMAGQQPVGMDAATAALFPDSIEDSVLGEIPKDWRVGKIEDVVKLNETTIKKDYPYQEIQYVDISSVTVGRLEGATNYLLSDAPSRAKRLVKHGDTIWSGVRPNRKSYLFIHDPDKNLVVSTGFIVLSPNKIPPSYLYSWVTTGDFVDYLTFNADGSAYPAVRVDRFADAKILIPPSEILENFERNVGKMRDKIAKNEQESQTLSTLRDTLLPKLMSGEIRVAEAERLIADSV
jgi:type I restriction enzyme, S subunit